VGQGEFDRNMCVDPVPVHVYDCDWDTSVKTHDKLEDYLERARLSPAMRIQKSHARVGIFDDTIGLRASRSSTLLSPPPSLSALERSPDERGGKYSMPAHGAFEVVLHHGEASLQPMDLSGLPDRCRLVHVSSGWKHTLAIVDDLSEAAEIE